MRKGFAILLCLLTAFAVCGLAEHDAYVITEHRALGKGGSYVSWPEAALEDEAVSQRINAHLQENCHLQSYLSLLDSLGESGAGLTVKYEVFQPPMEDIVSFVVSAKGRMLSGRPSQVWYATSFDLKTGERLVFADLFSDPESAVNRMEAYIETQIEPNASDYLENASFVPLPEENFALCENGILLNYPYRQVSCLSGYAGAVLVPYSAVSEEWLLTVPEITNEDFALSLLDQVKSGTLPGLPVHLGQALDEVADAYRVSVDPGAWPGGIFVEAEDARFAGSAVMADGEGGSVTGLFSSGMLFPAMKGGEMDETEVLRLFGQPDRVHPVGQTDMVTSLLPPGKVFVYTLENTDFAVSLDSGGLVFGYLIGSYPE